MGVSETDSGCFNRPSNTRRCSAVVLSGDDTQKMKTCPPAHRRTQKNRNVQSGSSVARPVWVTAYSPSPVLPESVSSRVGPSTSVSLSLDLLTGLPSLFRRLLTAFPWHRISAALSQKGRGTQISPQITRVTAGSLPSLQLWPSATLCQHVPLLFSAPIPSAISHSTFRLQPAQ